ncbi:hypothetical protein AB0G04_25645 [Actinoplanes sp. NPDC023801]|uniref:hypothetical protein n=1 Tax=Actinoplanes sp. NPDC023801 TaxID=3154595 RepID=UPI0033F773A7
MRVPRPSLGATADVVGLALAALAVISFVVGQLGWLLGLSCAAVAVGGLALVVSWQRRRPMLTAVAVLVVGLGAGGVGAVAASASAADTAAGAELRFNPQLDPVPYCQSYSGTGTVPDGYQLLIFDRASGSGDPYYFHKQAEKTDRGWVARTIGIGLEPAAAEPDRDRGARIDLFAQLVTEETARVLRDRANIAIFPESPAAQWLLRELPGRTTDTLQLVRAAGPGTCTPN